MEQQVFSPSEVENLQRLIADNPPDELMRDEQIKDSDILFFSQYGHLEGNEDDSNFHLLQGIDDNATNDDFSVNPKEIAPAPSTSSDASFETVKSELLPVLAQTKFREMDGKRTRVFECGICGKEFSHQYTLMRHLPTHTDERKFHCLTCGKAFRQMSTLSQHRAIHSSERPYVCEVCNKNFNRVSTLISHKKTHTGLKPHRCHLCNKAFHQKGNLRNHIFTHTNERPYKCDVCDKGFNQMSNLMCHKMKAHKHQGDLIPKFPCKVCGEEFVKRIYLRQHEQFRHGMSSSGGIHSFRDYSNAILVDPINTEAMKIAMLSGDTPFALLRPLSGIPVLVRVIPAGQKQMLVPASAEDLKKYGRISIKPKVAEAQPGPIGDKENQAVPSSQKTKGCVVQIKVPVVATVIQKSGCLNGPLAMNVVSPDSEQAGFVYTSTLTDDGESGANCSAPGIIDSFIFDDKFDLIGSVANAEIEFVDQSGNAIDGSSFQKNLDVNTMEFNFDLPQEPRGKAEDEMIIFKGGSSAPGIQSSDIPDKILLEDNGQFIEL